MATRTKNQLIGGLIFITIGLVFLLRNTFDFISHDFAEVFLNWHSIMLYVGIALLIIKPKQTPGIVLTVIGGLFTFYQLNDEYLYLWYSFGDMIRTLWPLAFIAIGGAILWRGKIFGKSVDAWEQEGEAPGK